MSAMRKVTLNIYYGNRVSVVVRGWESRPHGEGRQSFFNTNNKERCVRHYEKSRKCIEKFK